MSPIEQLVKARRGALAEPGLPVDGTKIWGLALSGGGIRSATFCFGLLRALAARGLLLRFDLISTVSGGGYVGATLGRLFSRATSAADIRRVAASFADASSRWFAWWLRANGRYLIPRGAKDRTYAIGLYLRNLAAIHFELGIMAITLGCILGAVDLAGWSLLAEWGYRHPELVFSAGRYLPGWLPVVVFLEPVAAVIGGVVAIAYWCVPWLVQSGKISFRVIVVRWGGVAAITAALVWLFPLIGAVHTDVGATNRLVLWGSGVTLLAAWLIGVPLSAFALLRTDPSLTTPLRADLTRTRLTNWLAFYLRTGAFIAIAGAVDRAAWFLAFESRASGRLGVILVAAAAVIRGLLPVLSSMMTGRSAEIRWLWLGRTAGYAFTFGLCAWWVSLVYAAALGAAFQHQGPNYLEAWAMLAVLGLPAAGYILLTGRNFAFLNLSSLHSFYRARLARSYLGAANGKRFGQKDGIDAINALPVPMPVFPAMVSVGEPQSDDDVALVEYLPQKHGGPVHLINVCVNQTRDPRGGLYNQDRRGLAMTVASGGQMQVSQGGWKKLDEGTPLSLSTWTAISGAAIAPGLGSLTRGGISALATFAGLRLGYWWNRETREKGAATSSSLVAKSVGLIRETFGIFRGTDRPDWFLTDGGHFENTGAYALLAERAEVIVLADCGADPEYAFGDVENLVRKARIDLQAEILFQRPTARPRPKPPAPSAIDAKYRLVRPTAVEPDWPEVLDAFGSLSDLASSTSTACLALARITYGGERGGSGILILVKPNVSSGLPVDLVNFKAQNPKFPQQTTADQFFSEAQWESYSQLGFFLGGKLNHGFVTALIDDKCAWFERDEVAALDMPSAGKHDADAATGAPRSRLPARIGSTAVTSIGLGAAATVGVSAWQAIDSFRVSAAKQVADERGALKELTDLWAEIAPAAPAHARESAENVRRVGALAAAIVRSADTLCPAHQEGWFQASPLATSIYNTALKECTRLSADGRPEACTVLLEASHPSLQRPLPHCLVRNDGISDAVPPPRYWVYDYGSDAAFAQAHPCDPVAAARRSAEIDYETGVLRLEDVDTAGSAPDLPAECLGRALAGVAPATANRAAASAPAAVSAAPPALAPPPTMPDVVNPGGASAAPPVAPVASSPGSSASGAASAAADVCKGVTVYTQTYGGEQRDAALAYREQWRRLGASVPPIEDVYATARSAGRAQPLAVSRTTVRYHDADDLACATQLGRAVGASDWIVEPLSPRFRALPGTVEVWIAPGQRAKTDKG